MVELVHDLTKIVCVFIFAKISHTDCYNVTVGIETFYGGPPFPLFKGFRTRLLAGNSRQ